MPHCQLLQQKLVNLAKKYPETKFVKIRSEEAIPNYPDKNLPTLLIYHKSDIINQFIGLKPFGGENMTEKTLEAQLQKIGAIKGPKNDEEEEED